MDKLGLSLCGLALVGLIAWCTIPNAASAPRDEQSLAEAYHCGMLDALQEKLKRGKACDLYKSIAQAKGVIVPP
jgi:hypothetical protein